LQDPAFAETAEALLFPPPVVPAVELTVKPHRNWVLFRRPRTKQCAPDLVVVPPPAKHYDVFELAVPDAAHVTPIRNALWQSQSDVIAKLAPRYVDRVEFAGGQGALNTSATQVRADWSGHNFPPIIQYAAIADAGPGEGTLLARSRLTSLEQTLASVAQVDPDALAEAVPTVPQPLVRAGADGVILLVTRPAEVQTTCMLVLRMNGNPDAFKYGDAQIVELVNLALGAAAGGAAAGGGVMAVAMVDVAAGPPVHMVGQGIFDVGSTQLTPDSGTKLKAEWVKLGAQAPDPRMFVYSRQGDASAEPALLHDRAVQVAEMMGGPQPTPSIHAIAPALPGGCPSVAFVFAQG
jgi:predicted RecA/RadA family phage recombinase